MKIFLLIILCFQSAQGFTLFKSKKMWYHNSVIDVDGDSFPGSQQIDSIFQRKSPGNDWSQTKPQVITVFDCNDSNQNIFPGSPEVFNGIDDDCNGQVDEGFQFINIIRTGNQTKQTINGFCNELWQWERSHRDIDIFSEPFSTNYLLLHPQYATFNNAMANAHFLRTDGSGTGYNFNVCQPYPTSTLSCQNTPTANCTADGLGCYTHSINYYQATANFFALNRIALTANINPYVSDWNTQRLYIQQPQSVGVNVVAIAAGNELQQSTWYANSYYFPQGGKSYKTWFNHLADSCHKYFPSIPVLMWSANVWEKGQSATWNTDVAGANYNAIHIYAQTKDVTNRLMTNQAMSEQQAIDSVLLFATWVPVWVGKIKAKFGNVKIFCDTYGTNPEEQSIGGTFIGDMQTAWEQICWQLDTNIVAAQEYRTRAYNLNSRVLSKDVLIKQLRATLYGFGSETGILETGNREVVGIAQGNVILILNFSPDDFPLNIKEAGEVKTVSEVNGFYALSLLDPTENAIQYSGGNVAKGRSITVVKLNQP